MSEYRRDPVCGYWVIVAAERALRPQEYAVVQPARTVDRCPFCEGNESETPREVFAVRGRSSSPDGPGWRIRVVPNKYPAVSPHQRQADPPDDLHAGMPGMGIHELVIEGPEHSVSISELGARDARLLFIVYRERLLQLKKDPRIAHAVIFKNVRPAGGATIEHAHSQLVAMPIVSHQVAVELAGWRDYYDRHDRCVYCEIIASESVAGERIVCESSRFLAFCPFASRVPLETWIAPKKHSAGFENTSDRALDELSGLVRMVVAKIEDAAGDCAYNYALHSAPFDIEDAAHYHWHMEIIPRTTALAGFELGSGFFINPVAPEEAAAVLKKSAFAGGEKRSEAGEFSD